MPFEEIRSIPSHYPESSLSLPRMIETLLLMMMSFWGPDLWRVHRSRLIRIVRFVKSSARARRINECISDAAIGSDIVTSACCASELFAQPRN